MGIITVNKDNFDKEVLSAEKPVLADFFTTWCGDCKRIAVALDMIAEKKSEEIISVKIDCDAQPELKKRYDIMAYPTLYVFKNGKPGKALVEPFSKAEIDEWLNSEL
ncbi:MAG: thioredoxin family protein [Spirochaetales bacterium]